VICTQSMTSPSTPRPKSFPRSARRPR
jgi:hypothetical protein